MELVFIFTVVLFEVLFIDFFEVVKIIRALWIYVFMNDEIFPVFLRDESVAAMRTSKFDGREATFIRREMGVTDFAEKLSFGTIILIKERFRSITTRTAVAVRDTIDYADETTVEYSSFRLAFVGYGGSVN